MVAGLVLLIVGSVSCDSDTDTDSDTGIDPDETCIASISGQVLFDDGTPLKAGTLQICVPQCATIQTDAEGKFFFSLVEGDRCKRYYFVSGTSVPIHITLIKQGNTHTEYTSPYTPTRDEVSDQGPDDLDLDVGILYMYELPSEGVPYKADMGASVELSGVSFELPPSSLIGLVWDESEEDFIDSPFAEATIKVFKAPLGEWDIPFDVVGLDALYYIAPYWTRIVSEEVRLSIDPIEGWSEGDKGKVYMLGEMRAGLAEMPESISVEGQQCITACDECEEVEIGELSQCGSAELKDGKIVTAPIPRLGWVGIKK